MTAGWFEDEVVEGYAEREQCSVVGSSDVGYCRCELDAGHETGHRCQHEWWS